MLRRMLVVPGLTALALALALALAGCAAQATRPVQTSAGMTPSEQWRLQTLEERFLEFREGRLDQKAELDRLNELLDSLDRRQARTEEDLRAMDQRLGAWEGPGRAAALGSPAPAAPAPSAPSAPPAWSDVPVVAPAKAAKAAASAAKPGPGPGQAASPAADPAYDKALALIRNDKSGPGRKAMQAFLAANPKSPLAANAQYWIGESYYNDKDDAQAVLEFKKVYQAHPRHAKAAAALLKIGFAYERLGDPANARFYLEALLEDYPASDSAPLARKKLGTLPR